ncbi:hypothetical protein RFI_03875, partial [Reticulomyxa filosa]
LTAYVIVENREKTIKIKKSELTFEALLRQSYICLELQDFQKMKNENLRLEMVDMKDDIIESDETVKREFKNDKPTFKVTLRPIEIGKTKIISNALVVMIGISKYIDNKKWPNLKNVKDIDMINFKQLFKQELNYKFVCNEESTMNKEDVHEFLADVIAKQKLHKNKRKYDALIIILSGHGNEGDVLVTSEGDSIPIDEIRTSFDCNRMKSLKDCPKIFIIDVCRGNYSPQSENSVLTRGENGPQQNNTHNGSEFLMIWSTTKGYQVSDLALLSTSMRHTIGSKYKSNYSLNQMLKEVRADIQKKNGGSWYCVQSEDTTTYDIRFQPRKLV